MISVTIAVRPHLAAYLYVRFANCVHSGALRLPSSSTLYHLIGELTVKRSKNVSWNDTGNLTFALPHPRLGKDPQVYNYLGADSARIIEQEIDTLLKMDLYSRLLRDKYQHGMTYTRSLNTFMEEYHIADTNDHALMKAFQRWRAASRGGRLPFG